ncbi:MAG: type I-E CRISPR-associated endonuclease Cas1 [Deltaproteobacteria bacterium]|nr:type I-E CRISPR-associated endonuclease Cas1 [Deltaproteobacteria bacterium]
MLKGRLGIETARIPHSDRHGCIWLTHGNLYVEDGTLRFKTPGGGQLPSGDYALPFQTITNFLMGPGTTVSHDALRLMARHGTGLVATGDDGVRFYASMPFGSDESALARRQVEAWADKERRVTLARRMYAWRLGEVLPSTDIAVLRGIEGARVKTMYKRLAQEHGVDWTRRAYDREDPEAADKVNQALNHASTAIKSAAMIAVAATSTIPQLGFIHEDSANSFCLDIADLFRETVALPAAFRAVKQHQSDAREPLERTARRAAGRMLRDEAVVPAMIDRIKALLEAQAP